jgi:malate synthase
MTFKPPAGIEINAPIRPGFETILTEPALALVAKLHRAFDARRHELLAVRAERAKRLDAGERPDFLAATASVRAGDWKIAPVPRRCSAGASRSPARSTRRWSSTPTTRAPIRT